MLKQSLVKIFTSKHLKESAFKTDCYRPHFFKGDIPTSKYNKDFFIHFIFKDRSEAGKTLRNANMSASGEAVLCEYPALIHDNLLICDKKNKQIAFLNIPIRI